jgi:hypothetical protein
LASNRYRLPGGQEESWLLSPKGFIQLQVSEMPHPSEGNYNFLKAISGLWKKEKSNSYYRISSWDVFEI